jgi:hypothetical protein
VQLTTPTLDPVPEILGWLRIADPVFGDDSLASFAWFAFENWNAWLGRTPPDQGPRRTRAMRYKAV